MVMACHPHHITSLSFDSNGWIIAQKDEKPGHKEEEDNDDPSIEITPACKRLLKELKLDLSCDLFNKKSNESAPVTPLEVEVEDLPPEANLFNSTLRVIAEVRRLGAPSEADLKRRANKKGGGQSDTPRRSRRGRDGKVAQLEEQRRLRKEQEQQKLEKNQQNTHKDKEQGADKAVSNDGKGGVKSAKSNGKGEKKDVPSDGDGFIPVGGSNDPNPADELDIPVELRLAAVFNTLRVLITVLRPALDHPKRRDLDLKMKNGPTIKKEGKHKYYLISQHVYCALSHGSWNEINRQWTGVLNDMRVGLPAKMSKMNDDGQYELDAKDFVVSLFNYEVHMNQELVAEKCFGSPEPDTASKCHDALMNRFETEHDGKQNMLNKSISQLQDKLMHAISRRFRGVRLTVYGSCLSGLALQGSHDVDVSIFIPELDQLKRSFDKGTVPAAEYEKKMRKIIFQVRDTLEFCRSRSFSDLFAVTRARVPVVKGADIYAENPYTQDGSLSFDLCFLNDIAVVNSSLIREYSLFDNRVRILMLSVKSFAKLNDIASAANGTLSSYSWLNLVVFYLQCIGFLPALQCPKMMEEHDFKPDPTGNPWHCINGLETFYLTKDLVAKKDIWKLSSCVRDANTSMLLYGFFNFYSNIFSQQTVAASIRYGNQTLQKTSMGHSSKLWRLCVEDPFETCTSHCPHDLGCHVNEDGQKRISEHLMRATEEFGELMQQPMESNDTISVFLSRFLGPVPKTNGKKKKAVTSAVQSSHYQHRNAPRRDKGRSNTTHHNNRNTGAQGKYTSNNQHYQNNGKSHKSNKGGNDNGKFNKTDHGNAGANRARPNQQKMYVNNNPADDDKFVKQQAEKLRQMRISKEENRKARPNKNKKGAANGDAFGGKPNKPADTGPTGLDQPLKHKRNTSKKANNKKGEA